MILGIGIDIVEIARIESSLEKFGDRFVERIFTVEEIAYCRSMKHPARHFAARFAAKEAVSKAFGCGIGREMDFCEIEVRRDEKSAPVCRLHGRAAEHAKKTGVARVFLSLTHSDCFAAANAVLVSA